MALPYKFSGRSCIKWVMMVLLLEAISHMEAPCCQADAR